MTETAVPRAVAQLDEDQRLQLGGPGLRTFFRIAQHWRLSEHEQAAILGVQSIVDVKEGEPHFDGSIDPEILTRISYVFGIYKALHMLLPTPKCADEWMHADNKIPGFEGERAIDIISTNGRQGLQQIRRYLDAQLV